jgi:hypothetical protein
MNRKQNPRWLFTALLAIGSTTLFSAAAQAQRIDGSFKLLYTVHWGLATLPAGDYTFEARSSSEPFLLTIRGEGTGAVIMAQGRSSFRGTGSALQIMKHGNQAVVSSLQLAPYGLTFNYISHHRGTVQEEAFNGSSGTAGTSSKNTVAWATLVDVPARVTVR